MSFCYYCLQVQKLLVKHNISGERSSSSSSSDDDDADSAGSDDGTAAAAARGSGKRSAAAAAAGTPSKRLPVDVETLQELFKQQQGNIEMDDVAAAAGDSTAAAAAAAKESVLEGIAEQLPVPANAQQVLLWLQQAGIVQTPKPHKTKDSKQKGEKRRIRLAGGSSKAAAASAGVESWEDDEAAAADNDGNAGTQSNKKQKQKRRACTLDDVMEEDDAGVAAAAAAAAAAVRRVGAVLEPQPLQLLGYLQALQQAHEHSQRCDSFVYFLSFYVFYDVGRDISCLLCLSWAEMLTSFLGFCYAFLEPESEVWLAI
jgi:hypothetical protein